MIAVLSQALHLTGFNAQRCVLLSVCLLLSACGGEPAVQDSSNWPTRPIRIVIPFGPGGLADVTMRLAADELGQRLGQPVVMENRPGAGGVAATSAMLNAAADGHTLIVLTNGTTIAETQFPDLPYDITEALQPVSSLAWFDLVLLTGKTSGMTSLQELQQLAATREQGLRIGTINPGSTQHLSAELFKRRAGVNATIITYRTTPDVLGALIRNEVDLGIDAYTALKGAIDSGDAVALAVTGTQRNPALPETPTVAESGIADYVVTGWNALYTHKAVPAEIVGKINTAVKEVAALPDIQARFRDLGVEARASTPQAMQEQLLSDIARWHAVMEEAEMLP